MSNETTIYFTTVIISIISSTIVSYFAIKIENSSEKKKRKNNLRYDILKKFKDAIQNRRMISPELINELVYSKYFSQNIVDDLVIEIDKYNVSLFEYVDLIKSNLIDMYIRLDSKEHSEIFEDETPYLDHHFDSITNEYLNKMAFYLCHDNYMYWLESDFETLNFFKRKVWRYCSDGFEMRGIEMLTYALRTSPMELDNFNNTSAEKIDIFMHEEGYTARVKMLESSEKIFKVVDGYIVKYL